MPDLRARSHSGKMDARADHRGSGGLSGGSATACRAVVSAHLIRQWPGSDEQGHRVSQSEKPNRKKQAGSSPRSRPRYARPLDKSPALGQRDHSRAFLPPGTSPNLTVALQPSTPAPGRKLGSGSARDGAEHQFLTPGRANARPFAGVETVNPASPTAGHTAVTPRRRTQTGTCLKRVSAGCVSKG